MLEKFSGTPWISTKLSSQTRKKAVNCHLSGSSQPFLNSKIPETISNVDLTLFCNQNTGNYIKYKLDALIGYNNHTELLFHSMYTKVSGQQEIHFSAVFLQ